jgi:hypothetical protein
MAHVNATFPDLVEDLVSASDNEPPRLIGVYSLGIKEDRQLARADKDNNSLLDELLDDETVVVPVVEKPSTYKPTSDNSDGTSSHTTTSECSTEVNVGMDEGRR